MPKISILTACYNHEKYLKFYIESLLIQNFEDWELLIVDDNSKDKSVDIIKQYDDPRIRLFCNDINQGPGAAWNKAYANSTGDFFVICASDDMIKPDYFKYLLDEFDKGYEIIYSPLQMIDNDNKRYSIMKLPDTNDRFKLLSRLFKKDNCLYSPGMSFNKRLADIIFPTNVAMVQHQDYQWHIKMLINSDKISFANKPYILYRKINTTGTLSTVSLGEYNRSKIEIFKVMDTFTCIKNIEIIQNMFPDCEIKENGYINFELAKQALKADSFEKKLWGYNLLLNIMENDCLSFSNDFTFGDFLKIANKAFYPTNEYKKHKFKFMIKKIIKGYY